MTAWLHRLLSRLGVVVDSITHEEAATHILRAGMERRRVDRRRGT
jgi:hypothetical protein